MLSSLSSDMWAPWLPGSLWETGVGEAFRVPGLITFLLAEDWATPKVQGRYRSLFRRQVLSPTPEDLVGWIWGWTR